MAYKIREKEIQDVVDHLDYREKGGYEKKILKFYPLSKDEQPFDITIYLGDHNNVNYGGPADLNEIATQVSHIVDRSGKSGHWDR